MDFGLAKLTEMAASTGTSASMSPTMLGTVAGQVMGTAGYMAPEQVNGEEIDHRADLFAFGSVLYEMVTGRRAFAGESVVQTLSKIAHEEPAPLSEIVATSPPDLQRIVGKCLAKHPGRRYQHADDVAVDLRRLQDDIASGAAMPAGEDQATVAPVAVETTRGIPWTLAVPVAIATLLIGVFGTWWATLPVPEASIQFKIELLELVDFTATAARRLAISPDGSRIVFVANDQLWTRLIGDVVPTPIPGTEGGTQPFFSTDGQEIGFVAWESNQLKRVSITGGAPSPVGAAASGIFGASWADNGMIYFGSDGIWKVPGMGGTPEVVIEMQDNEQAYGPQLLPGSEWLLFTLRTAGTVWNSASLVAQSLTQTPKTGPG